MIQLRVISLFAGIGGFDLGFERAGMKIVAHVEKHPQCRKLLAAKWPDAIALDDVCTAGKHNLPPCDVICGGFPCQDVSIAGKRAGLKTEAGITRSGLFYQLTRIADEIKPALIVWENVPGLLSSDNGRDFARVLIELGRIGYSGAWTTVDAQYYGVAQSRRRVFGVFARGDIGAERCAEILSLKEGLRGHPAPCRKTGKVAPAIPASGAGISRTGNERTETGFCVEVAGAMMGKDSGGGMRLENATSGYRIHQLSGTIKGGSGDRGYPDPADSVDTMIPVVCGALSNGAHQGGGLTGKTPIQAELSRCLCGKQQRQDSETETFIPIGGGFDSLSLIQNATRGKSQNGLGVKDGAEPMYTLDGGSQHAIAVYPIDTRNATRTTEKSETNRQGVGIGANGDPSGTLTGLFVPAVAFQQNASGELRVKDTAYTLNQNSNASGRNTGMVQFSGVRRLTVTECERLQGFPDGWTLGFADGPRYRMLGNAVCVPCAEWIGKRIVMELGRIQEGK